ncbi:MAG: PQQ-binding-like beta-propeller repeat protein [Phycisphaerae bacterium]
MKTSVLLALLLAVVSAAAPPCRATESEHIGIQVLPAPGKVKVDGRFDDWDLTGGVLACGDVENLREKLSVWFHMMHDAKGLYLLARWNDATPLNNPGSSRGDYGFQGDCLQVRIVTAPGDRERLRASHLTCWRDRDGIDVVHVAYGLKFDQGGMEDAQRKGAVQEFGVNGDRKGYVQEIFMPWALLCRNGVRPKAPDRITVTVEPNFCTEALFRISIKDVFKPDVVPDRVFTFMSSGCWGAGTLEAKGNVPLRPVRLSDGREFKVTMKKGLPVVDWTGLIQVKRLLGHKTIDLTVPQDGYVSLHIRGADGAVVRHLLNASFRTAGQHAVKWDGLTTPNWRSPGEPAGTGEYTWHAIWHGGVGLRLVGWAHNAGSAPWDAPSGRTNWGGDHGVPICCDHDDERVYLGWSGAEAGKALLACDLDGNIQWKNSRGGMAGCTRVAVDGRTVYAQNWKGVLYRLDATTGAYTNWEGSETTDLAVASLWPDLKDKAGEKKIKDVEADALHAAAGRLYVGLTQFDRVGVLDAGTGRLLKTISIRSPVDLEAGPDGTLYVLSEWTKLLAVDPATAKRSTVVEHLGSANGLAIGPAGRLYVGLRGPDHQVRVYDRKGELVGTIGRKGGRPALGKWVREGMRHVAGMTVDPAGRLWVMEAHDKPKRISVWDTKTGAFVKEFFGPTAYGALGGAINPADPLLMVGHGCEWRLEAKTGRASCLGVITHDGMSNARFGIANGGRVYLAVASNWAFNTGPLKIYERAGEADYRLRTVIFYVDAAGREAPASGHGQGIQAVKTACWADENGDGKRQPNEIASTDGILKFSAWYMNVTPELALYSGKGRFPVKGFTKCGSPRYDLSRPVRMPAAGLGSADGRLVLQGGDYGVDMTWLSCYDIATGRLRWRYPDNFNGVHGSHRACPPRTGMIRGSFGPCGSARLPEPVGNIWMIATNVGEWHILTGEGFYLARLFEGDPMKMSFPPAAAPGAILDHCPPGMGGEDFGGSIACTADGGLYCQAGKTAFWNVRVVGLDSVKRLKGGTIRIGPEDLARARAFRTRYLQEAVGTKRMAVRKLTPAFTGDFDKDFRDAGARVIEYSKQPQAAVRSAAAWDDGHLYLAWDVRDATPWINGAEAPEYLYAHGDTVDFQLATDPKADPKRSDAAVGDLRLSIGPFRGEPTAVLYRPRATDKAPRTFYSGVVRDGYTVESVRVVKDARILVKPHRDGKGYTLEAAVPLSVLGVKPAPGLKLRADLGVTHGDKAGKDTVLRTYWHNQNTGIVNDEVFELKLEPRNWGEITFGQ